MAEPDLFAMIEASLAQIELERAEIAIRRAMNPVIKFDEPDRAPVVVQAPLSDGFVDNPKIHQPLKAEQIAVIIHKIKPLNKVLIQYKRNAARDVTYLAMMGGINIEFRTQMDGAVAYAVASSGFWSRDENRIFQFTAVENWNVGWFADRVQHCIEYIEVLS